MTQGFPRRAFTSSATVVFFAFFDAPALLSMSNVTYFARPSFENSSKHSSPCPEKLFVSFGEFSSDTNAAREKNTPWRRLNVFTNLCGDTKRNKLLSDVRLSIFLLVRSFLTEETHKIYIRRRI